MKKLRGFEIQNSLEEKCWKLSSYVLSQYDFEYLSHPGHEYWCIFNKYEELFQTTFFKELIEVCGLIRSLLDSESLKVDKTIAGVSNDFGILKDGKNTKTPLSFREACNKIIHSKKYSIELNRSSTHPLDNGKNGYNNSTKDNFKDPKIIVIGERNGKNWTAEIDFLKFIDQALNLIKH